MRLEEPEEKNGVDCPLPLQAHLICSVWDEEEEDVILRKKKAQSGSFEVLADYGPTLLDVVLLVSAKASSWIDSVHLCTFSISTLIANWQQAFPVKSDKRDLTSQSSNNQYDNLSTDSTSPFKALLGKVFWPDKPDCFQRCIDSLSFILPSTYFKNASKYKWKVRRVLKSTQLLSDWNHLIKTL